MKVLAGLLLFALVFYLALVWFAQRSLLFPRPILPGQDVATGVAGLERWWIGESPRVEAWYLPPTAAEPTHPALIFGHGNGELIDFWASRFGDIRAAGVGVLLVEYPGYGRSEGSPSERSVRETFLAAYDRLVEQPGIDAERIVGYGRSLGGGAICQLAEHRPLAALVLESTFTGVAPMARSMGVPRFLVRDPFDNRTVVSGYQGPVLLLHGVHDRIIPFEHSEELHAVAARAELVRLECGHNDCPRSWSIVRAFLAEVGILPAVGPSAP